MVRFCNIDFKLLSRADIFRLDGVLKKPKFIIPVNACLIWLANSDKRFMKLCCNNYACFDGTVPLKQARKKCGGVLIEKISGSDIIYDFCRYAAEQKLKLFLLGGKEESNTAAVMNIHRQYGIQIQGYSPLYEGYPFSEGFREKCLEKLRAFHPDILFVGFGAPKQEFFIEDCYEQLQAYGVSYVVGCGGTIDFVAGSIKRAPFVIQNMGLEGVYRFLKEPNKMRLKRLRDSLKFFKYINHNPDYGK